MAAGFMHFNADVYEHPRTFNPERWLQERDGEDALDTWLVPFSRGSRMCVGLQ